jgi:hypothetical protein
MMDEYNTAFKKLPIPGDPEAATKNTWNGRLGQELGALLFGKKRGYFRTERKFSKSRTLSACIAD